VNVCALRIPGAERSRILAATQIIAAREIREIRG
jgi:hypothetical protein